MRPSFELPLLSICFNRSNPAHSCPRCAPLEREKASLTAERNALNDGSLGVLTARGTQPYGLVAGGLGALARLQVGRRAEVFTACT